MHIHTLQREQWVAKKPDRVFPFFAQPGNLALITPPGLRFRLLTPGPITMESGRVIDYTIRVLGLPVRWRTLITRYDPPRCFVDEQLNGPYSFWHHTHRFSEVNGGTLLEDEVRYALPLMLAGPANGLVQALYVRPALSRIFDYRQQVFSRLFGSAEPCGAQGPAAVTARTERVA